jgi:riboflavin kinase/FMN adenylyltransferase
MRILRHPERGAPADLRGAAVALGNFDGVHRGHRGIIAHAGELARAEGRPWGVVTFEPHPRSFFQGDAVPFRLTPFRQKARLLDGLGLGLMANLRFDPAMAGRSAQDFVAEVLVKGLGVAHVVTGPGFVFGKGRRGNAYVLSQMAAAEGFAYHEMPAVAVGGTKVSSTEIRVLLRRGLVDEAGALLGQPWEYEGRVQGGDQRGRTMGFPTANLSLDGRLHPGEGIYAARAGIVGPHGTQWHDAAAYIGTRPTFNGTTQVLETFLFDFAGDLYGRHLRVAFVERVRKDMTFHGMEALIEQMNADCARARVVLGGLEGRGPHTCGNWATA